MMLEEHRKIWQSKQSLRLVYADLYKRMNEAANEGLSLEVGSGIGAFDFDKGPLVRSDIQPSCGNNIVCDAHVMPFPGGCFSNIFLVDVLHHLESPVAFLEEALRVLGPDGKIIMIEPGMSLLSYWFYKFFHHEPVDMSWEPTRGYSRSNRRDPYEGNQAIPTILFKGKHSCSSILLSLNLRRVKSQWLSLLAYPLTGGFSQWCLLPKKMAVPILNFEKIFERSLGWLLGFRLMVVIQKKSTFDIDSPEKGVGRF